MAEHVCPWWIGYLLALPIRRIWQDPGRIVGRYVRPGMTVLEPGPGMGFFTLELARRAGPGGRVVAVDVQAKMLASLGRRAARAGLADRIETRLAEPHTLGIPDLAGEVDFALAFAMVHELPNAAAFFEEVAGALKPGGTLLLAEPSGHVDEAHFSLELDQAARAGLEVRERPAVRMSLAALLSKAGSA